MCAAATAQFKLIHSPDSPRPFKANAQNTTTITATPTATVRLEIKHKIGALVCVCIRAISGLIRWQIGLR